MSDWMKKLTKNFGVLASQMDDLDHVISFPSPSLNFAFGNKGIIEGKICTLYGGESGGKSLLMQLGLIEIQKKYPNCICVLFDTEYSFNKDWFSKLGGDLDRLYVRQSNDPVKIFDYIWGEMLTLLQDGMPIKGIAIDSIKNICYPGDIKDTSTKVTMGGSGAKYLGSALKRIIDPIREYKITTFFVQQVYEEMDPMKAMRNPYRIPDGRALKHASDYMIEISRVDKKDGRIERGKDIAGSASQIGHKVRCKFKKNRTASPFRTAEFSLVYSTGIVDTTNEILELAKSLDVIFHPINEKTGKPSNSAWKFSNYDKIIGYENFKNWVSSNPNILEEIKDTCINFNWEVSSETLKQENCMFDESMMSNTEKQQLMASSAETERINGLTAALEDDVSIDIEGL